MSAPRGAAAPSSSAAPPRPRPRPTAASADPLVRRKKPERRPIRPSTASSSKAVGAANGAAVSRAGGPASTADPKAQGPYEDVPLFTTKRALLEGLKYHVMKFAPGATAFEKDINPTNDKQFVPPVRLQRRDPRNDPKYPLEGDEDERPEEQVDDKEKERQAAIKAERQAIREANLAQIAPVDKNQQSKKKLQQKKTEQVFRPGGTDERKKNWELRYEEAVPWHVEGFDDKQIWRGVYESQLSNNHIMITPDTAQTGQKIYRMLPLSKWYKFTHRSSKAKILQSDEAEAKYNAPYRPGRFDQHMELKRQEALREARESKVPTKLRKGERAETNIRDTGDKGDDTADIDDLDYDYDEAFADDEDNIPFEQPDEQDKETQEKVKREQLQANIFAMKEAKDELRDYDKEEVERKERAELEKKLGRRIEKTLKKQEKNYLYEDDSEDDNPYASKSESEDSEEERLREEENRKKLAAEGKPGEAGASTEQQPSSQSASNTPSGRPSKTADPLKKLSKKRPGSPTGSDLSGNESSRKKTKRTHSSNLTASQPPSRPMSPANVGASSLRVNVSAAGRKAPSNQGSDTEMSDGQGGKKKRTIRLTSGKVSPSAVSPNASRAGSPAAATATSPGGTPGPSKAGTVKQNTALAPATQDDIIALLKQNPDGIALQDLAVELNRKMERRLDKNSLQALKNVIKYDKKTRKITVRPEGEAHDTPPQT